METLVVADTNLFFECRRLEELPWADLGGDPVVILLTKPVLDEIDKHKKASGRTRKRAVEAFQRVRSMLGSADRDLVIQEAGPRVVLRLPMDTMPDPKLRDSLDYARNDDRIIGILSSLRATSPDDRITLLTDDAGPAATASGLGLPFRMISADWRRPPGETSEERRIRELEDEVSGYRRMEPVVVIEIASPNIENKKLGLSIIRSEAFSSLDIETAISSLVAKHPLVTDFSQPASSRPQSAAETVEQSTSFQPPDAEEIRKYQEESYPSWLDACRGILAALRLGNEDGMQPLELTWSLINQGSRPATDVLVEFEAFGPLGIRRYAASEDDEDVPQRSSKAAPRNPSALPKPPRAPAPRRVAPPRATITKGVRLSALRGLSGLHADPEALRRLTESGTLAGLGLSNEALQWAAGVSEATRALREMDEIAKRLSPFTSPLATASPFASILPDESLRIPGFLRHPIFDPEALYYEDDWPPSKVVARGSLTCKLWRHQTQARLLDMNIVFENEGDVKGSILCTVHADNLTRPSVYRLSVLRGVEFRKPFEEMHKLIEEC